jgi:hypothetical protein
MKKVILCALVCAALTSCKKSNDVQPGKIVQVQASCDVCDLVVKYQNKTTSLRVLGSGTLDVGSYKKGDQVDVSLTEVQLSSMQMGVYVDSVQVLSNITPPSYPVDKLWFNSVVL